MQFRKSLEPLNANSNRVRSLVVRQLIPNALCHAVVLTLSLGMTAGGEAFAQAKAGTATTLSVAAGGSAASSVAAGTVVTLTAQVTASGTNVSPGQVNFCDASTAHCTDIHVLATAQLTSTGTATYKFRPGLGSHSYKAVFVGTNSAAGSSSASASLSVTGTTGTFASNTSIASTGAWGNYKLNATVTETGGTVAPQGPVSFLDINHGNAALATGTLGPAVAGFTWIGISSVQSATPAPFGVGDFNGDGIPDFAVVNSSSIAIFLGKGDGTFTRETSSPSVGSSTGSIAVGDFNSDGKQDLALINTSTNTITVLLGNGDGTFTPVSSSPATGIGPTAITAADVNGDGIPDLAVTTYNYAGNNYAGVSTVTVLLGNGDGTFTVAAQSPSVAVEATAIVAADFNGDDKLDLAITAQQGETLTILLGNGDGTFTSRAGPTVTSYAQALAVADLNGDGIPDLVAGCDNGGLVAVLLGNGDGTFTAASAFSSTENDPDYIAVADFNGDGIPDLAILFNYNPGGVGIFLGNGDGTFASISSISAPSQYAIALLAAADLNGDGRPDLTVATDFTAGLQAYLTEPTETASASASVALSGTGQHVVEASTPAEGNYLASVSASIPLWGVLPTTATVLTVTSGGSAVTSIAAGTAVTLTAQVIVGATPVTSGRVNFCDATAPQCSDIHILGTVLVNGSGIANFKFVPGSGAHSYQAQFVEDGYGLASSSNVAALTVGARSVVYTDLTGISAGGASGNYSLTETVLGIGGPAAPTGNVSFVDTSFGNSTLATATLGPSAAGLGWLISQTPAISTNPVSEITGDFNGDGIPDIAVVSGSTSGGNPYVITILLGVGDGTFSAQTPAQNTGCSNAWGSPSLLAADFNRDGKADLVILCPTITAGDTVSVLLGNGDGTFAAAKTTTAYNPPNEGGDVVTGSMVAADFNGDGKLDLAIVGGLVASGQVTILLGNGDGTFTAGGASYGYSSSFNVIATGDFNRDGIPDLIVSDFFAPQTVFVLIGKGDGTFTASASPITGSAFITSMVVADFNGDGLLDVAIGYQSAVGIYLGNGDGTFTQAPGSPINSNTGLSLVAGDFNHDGKVDLAAIYGTNPPIQLFLGNGDGTFTITSTSPGLTTGTVNSSSKIVAADFNGDGAPDLAMLTSGVNAASILLAEPTETATATVTGIAPIGAGTHNVDASYSGDSNYPSATSSVVALAAGLTPLVVTPSAGTYTSVQSVTISESIPGATIYYELLGPISTSGYVQYTGPISLPYGGTETLFAYATETGYQQSAQFFGQYFLNLPAAPAPTFSLSSGSYPGAQSLTITDTAASATIYYTTDGTVPTMSSSVYSGPLTVSTSQMVQAVAIASGYSLSSPARSQYWIASSQSRFIYTVAGTGYRALSGDNGPAVQAGLNIPNAVVFDNAGNFYIADTANSAIRKVAAGTSIITTIAGNGSPGYSGDNGPAANSQLKWPAGLAFNASGDLFIADEGLNVVRKIAAGTGIITTVAGNGTLGYTGDNGPATAAELDQPWGLVFDATGNLYIGTFGSIRKVAAGTGIITTYAGNGTIGYSGDNGPASAATLGDAYAFAFDANGNLYFVDPYEDVVREIAAKTQIITTVAGDGPPKSTTRFQGDGGPATSAQLYNPEGLAIDSAGNLYIADTYNFALREVAAANGMINTIAGGTNGCSKQGGDGGPASSALYCDVSGLAVGPSGNLYFADFSTGRIREITATINPPSGTTATPAFNTAAGTYTTPQTVTITDSTPGAQVYLSINGNTPTTNNAGYHGSLNVSGSASLQAVAVAPGYLPSAPTSAAYTITTPPSSVISTVAGSGIPGSSGDGGPASQVQFWQLNGLAIDASQNLYAVDPSAGLVWKVNHSTGTASIIAGVEIPVSAAIGDGGPATQARLNGPSHVVVDSSGNVYIADTYDQRVRKVSAATGLISTFAGGGASSPGFGDGGLATSAYLDTPEGLALDAAGNLYIADESAGRVRKVTAATGIITTVAGGGSQGMGDGGPATAAVVSFPVDLTFDAAGNLYILEAGTARIRMVAAGIGIITTVAGNGNPGLTGDGGLATNAQIIPEGIAVDRTGNLYISNWYQIRKVAAGGGTITTVAGTGYPGFGGDGGAAPMAEFGGTTGIVVDSAGNLYVADEGNARIREITYPGPASAPVFSLAAGVYPGPQSLTITDSTANASIYYTTDGSAPTTGSNLYTGPISIDSSETISAIAVATGYTASASTSSAYVIPTAPVITWPAPAPITYGTALTSTQLDASASVPGTFAYSPAVGKVLAAGTQTLHASFTPTDTTNYTATSASVSLTVNKATPSISWSAPASIIYGTSLAGVLNASATFNSSSVAGTFTYTSTPTGGSASLVSASTVLVAGSYVLTASFVPADPTDFNAATSIVALTVSSQTSVISQLTPAFISVGGPAFTLTVAGSGFLPTSTIYWGATALATQYTSATQLTAQVPPSDIATSGTTAITVQNPSSGGGLSNAFQFQVDSATSGSTTPPSFATTSATVSRGSSATYAVTLPATATNVSVACLNLPVGATCSYSSSPSALTITTSSATPAGTYQVTVVFTETLPGAASGLIFLSILLLPLAWVRRRSSSTGKVWLVVCVAIVITTAVLAVGCGGGSSGSGGGGGGGSPQTHTVTSSGSVTVTVQ